MELRLVHFWVIFVLVLLEDGLALFHSEFREPYPSTCDQVQDYDHPEKNGGERGNVLVSSFEAHELLLAE